jgi:hypothetical protein
MNSMLNPANGLSQERDGLLETFARAEPAAPARPKHKPSVRAQRVWDRLGDWYGARFADQYGDLPSQDWCTVIDNTSNDDLVAVLVLVRQQHVTFPPTLPEFAALVKEVRTPRINAPSVAEQLAEFVSKSYSLTPAQLRGPWTFLYGSTGGQLIVTGVVVAADGDQPGYRVSIDDMRMAAHRP